MESSIKAEFFNQFITDNNIDVNNLFYGKNSLAKRLIAFNLKIKQGKYPELLDSDGGIANALLNYLIPNTVKYEKNFKEPDYIETRTMFDQDLSAKNSIVQGWEELLEHPNEEINTLARDLVVYSFLTSADNKNMNSFFEFVPASWRISSGYSDFIQNKLDNGETSVASMDDLFLNNWRNNDLVPTIDIDYSYQRIQEDGTTVTETQQLIGITSKFPIIGTTINPLIIMAGHYGTTVKIKPNSRRKTFDDEGRVVMVPVYPPFVKVKYDRTSSDPRAYMIYKLIGYTEIRNSELGIQRSPIYIGVNKKGYDYKGHKMFEYGRESVNPFNGMPIGITQKDTQNGNLGKMIYSKKDWSEDLKKMYYRMFVKYHNLDEELTVDNTESFDWENPKSGDFENAVQVAHQLSDIQYLDKLGDQRKEDCKS